jgi:hypothetical protein
MSYPSTVKESYRAELGAIREKGIYKEERFIHSPQSAGIRVEFPAGAAIQDVVNMCSNNYLGLSSHPEVVAAAHRGLDERGYGMSSVRFICGTQDIHRTLEQKLTAFLGTEDTILFPSCMDANAGVSRRSWAPRTSSSRIVSCTRASWTGCGSARPRTTRTSTRTWSTSSRSSPSTRTSA